MDFTPMINQIDVGPVVIVMASIAALLILPEVARWSYNRVINWFDPDYVPTENNDIQDDDLLDDLEEYERH